MQFDLQIRDVTSALVDIKHPVTGELIGMQIELAGPENPQRKAIEFARQRKVRAGLSKTGKLELGDPVDDEQDGIELLAACTLSWSGVTDKGEPVPFTKAAALELYSTEGLTWLRGQLLTALGEKERFIKSFAAN